MRNSILSLPVILLLGGSALYAGWRSDVAAHLDNGSYAEAGTILISGYQGMEAIDKPEASALLAYIFHKQEDAVSEGRWLLEFFEGQQSANTDFTFLGIDNESQVTAFVNGWRQKFPRLTGAYLITRRDDSFLAPPSTLTLGLDLPLEVYFKLSDETGPLQGGLLHPGLNFIPLDAGRMFDASGVHVYTLDLKSGNIRLRKELALEVRLSVESASGEGPKPMDLEYKLTVFVGGREVATSRKTGRDKEPLALNIPPANMVANPLFKPPNSDDPFDPANRGASILDAINVAAGLIKDLFKSKDRPYQSPLEKKMTVTYSYFQGSSEGGGEKRASAAVILSPRPSRLL